MKPNQAAKNKSNVVELGRTVRGNIDGIFHHFLTGWCLSPNSREPIQLTLSVNGVPRTTATANLARPDVGQGLGTGHHSGFSFDLSEIAKDIGDCPAELTVTHDATGYNFNGRVVHYCQGASKHFELIREIFNPEFYRCRYSRCQLSNDEALQHFLTYGLCHDHDPNPWFSNRFYRSQYEDRVSEKQIPLICYLNAEHEREESPSSLLNIRTYASDNPDLEGTDSLLWHYAVHGSKEGRAGVQRSTPASIVRELEDIALLEPQVARAMEHLNKVVRYPHLTQATYLPKILSERYNDQIKVVICVPFISRGGADLISTFLFKAYQRKYGKEHVLMLVTDKGGIDCPEWIDSGSAVVSLEDETSFVDDEEKLLTLHICLAQLAPEKILNVNSHFTWKVIERYGVQMASAADLYAYLFCFDYDKHRRRVGYIPDYLPSTLKCLKAVYFDNQYVIDEINEIYGLPESESSKLHTVYVPAAHGVTKKDWNASGQGNRILWIGRLSLQKRPDVLVEIAEAMPSQQFDVYGPPGNSTVSQAIINGTYKNINYRGVYNTLDELDFTPYRAFLNTSEWDGLPTILIQMMAVGLPIITSSVCGIPELVNNDRGWLVDAFDSSDAYATTLRQALIRSADALERAQRGQEHVLSIHTESNFDESLDQYDAFVNHTDSDRVITQLNDRRKRAA